MEIGDLEKIKKEINNYKIEIVIGLWAIINEEINRRIQDKKK